MTLNEAITNFKTLRPNQYSDEQLVRWLSDADQQIYLEVMKWHKDAPEDMPARYSVEDLDQVLLVPEQYARIYDFYLCAQMDFAYAEIVRYNNDMVMFNTLLSSFADWYNREHMPKQDNYIIGAN